MYRASQWTVAHRGTMSRKREAACGRRICRRFRASSNFRSRSAWDKHVNLDHFRARILFRPQPASESAIHFRALDVTYASATNLSAATLVPSRRTVPATARAHEAISGRKHCARAPVRESLVGAPVSCAIPMPNVWTRCAQ